jgi:hypothetical protein
MDDRPMDNDDRSNFTCSRDGIRSYSLADVSVANDDSKILPAALRLVVLVIERGEDVTGRGA